MTTLWSEEQGQKMLSIIHQVPIGIIEADCTGNVTEMNAKGVQLLLPFFLQQHLPGTNIIDLLKIITPGIVNSLQEYALTSGTIVNQQHEVLCLNKEDGPHTIHYYFTVNKLAGNSYIYMFDDVTELYTKEHLLNQALQDKAVEQSKFDMASGVLHDIGNAVVGFGSYLLKIKRSSEGNDIGVLKNLKQFIEKQKTALSASLGEAKANAMADLLAGIIVGQEENQDKIKHSVNEQMGIISHIQEILNIQRQYITGQSTARALVNLKSIINDTISMLSASFEIKGITVSSDLPLSVPLIKGDRTKLMQVILNVLKNGVESVVENNTPDKAVHIALRVTEHSIVIKIKDTGAGFDETDGEHFFQKGITSKSEGTGLGLANCKSIIESHNGTIQLHSNGKGSGAIATLSFELSPIMQTTV